MRAHTPPVRGPELPREEPPLRSNAPCLVGGRSRRHGPGSPRLRPEPPWERRPAEGAVCPCAHPRPEPPPERENPSTLCLSPGPGAGEPAPRGRGGRGVGRAELLALAGAL